jgi:WD40 repeat protein
MVTTVWLAVQGHTEWMQCGAWSPCGTYIVAGNADGNAYLWHWPFSAPSTAQPAANRQDGQAAVTTAEAAAAGEQLHAADWPEPVPLTTLEVYRKGVWQAEFSHAGGFLATASQIDCVRVRGAALSVSSDASGMSMLVFHSVGLYYFCYSVQSPSGTLQSTVCRYGFGPCSLSRLLCVPKP